MSGPRYPWWLEPAAWLAAGFVKLLGATWQVDEFDDAEYEGALRAGERFVYVFWHARLLPLVYTHRHEGSTVLISRHRDGQLITRIIEHMGFTTARGSSTRGGEAGVRELLAAGEQGRHVAITPDGPRGPAEQAKDGFVFVAQQLSRRVVPLATSSPDAKSWRFRSWDRFRVPKPFARVTVAHGRPIALTGATAADRADVERELKALTAAADERAKAGR